MKKTEEQINQQIEKYLADKEYELKYNTGQRLPINSNRLYNDKTGASKVYINDDGNLVKEYIDEDDGSVMIITSSY